MSTLRRRCSTLMVATLLACAPLAAVAAPPPPPDIPITVTVPELDPDAPDEPFTVSDAQLRWGLNAETGSPAFFGGCNFLSAGAVGDTGGSVLWTATDGHYASRAGAVRIERPVRATDGTVRYAEVPFAQRCTGPDGSPVSLAAGTFTGVQAVIDGGTGTVDPGTGTTRISWDGAFTAVFYGGLTYWWVSDLELALVDGRGRLTGLVSGYGADREDVTRWELLAPRRVTLAEISGVSLAGGRGFASTPAYRGVSVRPAAGEPAQTRTGSDWGSFPQDFVTFQAETGQGGFWYSTGGARDPFKPASTLYVSYDADEALTPTPTDPPGTGDGGFGGGGFEPVPPGAGWSPLAPSSPVAPSGPGAALPGTPSGAALPAGTPSGAGEPVQGIASAAATFGRATAGIFDHLGADAQDLARNPLAWTLAGLLAGASGLLVAFRRGWLVLPWRGKVPR